MKLGDKLKFEGEKQRYTIQAFNNQYIIATKPFNARKTYLYTIVDIREKRRGPCDLIFGSSESFNTKDGALKNLRFLMQGKMRVSERRDLPLTEGELQAIIDLQNGEASK